MRLKATNAHKLYRDVDSKAIVNTDVESYNKYMEQSRRIADQRQKLSSYEQEIQTLRTEMGELKEAMAAILSRLNSKE
jgi:uncharacterized coiled-coil DUF342 family protein